jgi:hypothetical protein
MPASRPLSIVVVGAHVDDHWWAMGGTMLKAARNGHRVTAIQGVSTYCAWPVVTGREAEIKPKVARLCEKTGIRLVTLGHDYLRLVSNVDLMRQLAVEIAKAEPDILFCPWEDDSNQDHAAIGAAARIAAMHGPCFLPPEQQVKLPRQIFQYSLEFDPRTFRPNCFVNTTDVLFDSLELNNIWDEFYSGSNSPLWPKDALRRLTVTNHHHEERTVTLHLQTEQLLAWSLIRGIQCGVRYAEGFSTYKFATAGEDLLGQI